MNGSIKATNMIHGCLPMAGRANRLQPLPYSKELYPIEIEGKIIPVSEIAVSLMKRAVDLIHIVTREEKSDVISHYSDYDFPLKIHLHDSPSLPESCLYPIDELSDGDFYLSGLPDTIISDFNAYMKVREELENGADICLGVFEVEDATRFDSVLIRGTEFDEVVVKQNPPLSNWIWGVWGANKRGLSALKDSIDAQQATGEKLLGAGFNELASRNDMRTVARKIDGVFYDIGTHESLTLLQDFLKQNSLHTKLLELVSRD